MEESEKKILFVDVKSGHLTKVGHEKSSLFVVFSNGSCYEYRPVSRQDYEKLVGASSIGGHFIKHIRNNKSINHRKSNRHE